MTTATVSKEAFKAYERVRSMGATNMFDVGTVSMLSGLDRETIMQIMENYEELMTLYPDVK